MNYNFEYVLGIAEIKSNHSMVICKFCQMPVVRPVLCTNCYDFMCQICPITHSSNRCCGTDNIANLNDTEFSFNGKGAIAKILEELEIYCAINKENGCQWIGKRRNYLDHHHHCIKNYKICYTIYQIAF